MGPRGCPGADVHQVHTSVSHLRNGVTPPCWEGKGLAHRLARQGTTSAAIPQLPDLAPRLDPGWPPLHPHPGVLAVRSSEVSGRPASPPVSASHPLPLSPDAGGGRGRVDSPRIWADCARGSPGSPVPTDCLTFICLSSWCTWGGSQFPGCPRGRRLIGPEPRAPRSPCGSAQGSPLSGMGGDQGGGWGPPS